MGLLLLRGPPDGGGRCYALQSRTLGPFQKSRFKSHHSNVFVSYIEDTVFTCVCVLEESVQKRRIFCCL